MKLDAIYAIAGIVTVATITPGPNNFIVLYAAAHGGFRATTRLIVRIVAGGLALLCMLWVGAGWLSPHTHVVVGCSGAVYLLWLGAQMILTSTPSRTGDPSARHKLPDTWLAVFLIQLTNAKAWILLVTLVSVARAVEHAWTFPSVSAIFAGISASCLLIWSFLGTLVGKTLINHRAARGFNYLMESLLIISAFGLLMSLARPGE